MRVLLFGIDGLTFRILHPLMERGLLPNFQRLHNAKGDSDLKRKLSMLADLISSL